MTGGAASLQLYGAASVVSPFEGLRVLAFAPVGGYGGFNTSVHRIHALESLGCDVHVIDSAHAAGKLDALHERARSWLFRQGLPVRSADPGGAGVGLLEMARQQRWDLVWLEKALSLGVLDLAQLRAACPGALIVGFSPDDMHARHNQSQQFIEALPNYDAYLTTKSYNVAELRAAGCPQVRFVGNGYDPEAFRPLPLRAGDVDRLGGPVGFIGTYEGERAQAMLQLARAGVPVRVWGNGWENIGDAHANLRIENAPLYGDDFARACAAFTINLGFLRRMNRDQQTTRSVEIPACGGFMLAERSDEHQQLFVEGKEAEFFASQDELLAKCQRYLGDPEAARAIARRGLARCSSSGYSNAQRLHEALGPLLTAHAGAAT